MEELLFEFPHVIAWVAGHSHVNTVEPHANPDGRRLLEHPGRGRGRLAAAEPPDRVLRQRATARSRSSARSSTTRARRPRPRPGRRRRSAPTSSPRSGARSPTTTPRPAAAPAIADPCGEGEADDRNVELLVADPRRGGGGGRRRWRGRWLREPLDGHPRSATGSRGDRGRRPDPRAARGNDRLNGKAGVDCVQGGRGNDRIERRQGRDTLKRRRRARPDHRPRQRARQDPLRRRARPGQGRPQGQGREELRAGQAPQAALSGPTGLCAAASGYNCPR